MAGTGAGAGKLILCGEHAVVYGHPALAFAVDRHTEVALRPGPRRVRAAVDDPRLGRALDAARIPPGVEVHVRSTVPVGRGMGSSAALAVALVRAGAALRGEALSADEAFARALPVERVFHGNPSGLDVAVAARGGFVAFRRGPPARIEPIEARVPWSAVVLDTGIAGDTAALVAAVASRRPGVDPLLARIGALSAQAREALADPAALGEIATENHRLLAAIGVSHPEVERLVALAVGAGATGAKLSGAGGGGVVLAVARDPEPILRAARRAGVTAFACAVGAGGEAP